MHCYQEGTYLFTDNLSRFFSKVFCPMPLTLVKSSTLPNAPFSSLQAMIALAFASPMPFNVQSSSKLAVFRFTTFVRSALLTFALLLLLLVLLFALGLAFVSLFVLSPNTSRSGNNLA